MEVKGVSPIPSAVIKRCTGKQSPVAPHSQRLLVAATKPSKANGNGSLDPSATTKPKAKAKPKGNAKASGAPKKTLGSHKDPPATDAKKDIKKGATPASSSQKHEKTAYAIEKDAFMEKSLGSIGHVQYPLVSVSFALMMGFAPGSHHIVFFGFSFCNTVYLQAIQNTVQVLPCLEPVFKSVTTSLHVKQATTPFIYIYIYHIHLYILTITLIFCYTKHHTPSPLPCMFLPIFGNSNPSSMPHIRLKTEGISKKEKEARPGVKSDDHKTDE